MIRMRFATKIMIVYAALFSSGMICAPFRPSFVSAANSPVHEERIESTVIQIDEYAVYAPNLVFYFDRTMDKKKLEALRRTAARFRNRKAVITYLPPSNPDEDNRSILIDIASAQEKPPVREAAEAPAEEPVQLEQAPPEDNEAPEETVFDDANSNPAPDAYYKPERPARTARTEPITREEASAFVQRVLYLNGSRDLGAIAPFYADSVNYYDRGIMSRDKVLKDLKYYFRNWTQIDTRLEGEVLITGFDPDTRIVKFVSVFSVRNEKKSLSGKTENIWTIQRINGRLRLIDVKEKVLERH